MNQLERARRCARRMYDADRASRDLGIAVTIPAPGDAEAVMTVTADLLNGFAVCHGGYLFTLADTAFAFACN
ncbi:MAG: hydroxyphenylacetyl-CoA thioesterase PaaI, partial [Woeseiaceae bacterium]